MPDNKSDSALLKVAGLLAGYGEVEVLRNVDLVVNAGDMVAVLGSNGAGKSTLNLVISGIVPGARRRDRIRWPPDPECNSCSDCRSRPASCSGGTADLSQYVGE